ncbi:hypothetical protein BGZ76_011914 [Entomortierella beljakovae]|nr:hypothetical protein BGZ76_011914 [Entomortierella beljakovae]
MQIRAIAAALVVAPFFSIVSAISTDSRILKNNAAQYKINTSKLPKISKDLAALNQWSGNMPVGSDNSLFFWYIQAKDRRSDNVIFWYNGGPGCSSMEGLFDENGPYVPNGGSFELNPHSWHNIGHIIYVDQPFGTGFSHSNTTVPDEDFVGRTMVSFYRNFLKTFPELKSKKVYLTGESFAGRYIPYFAKHVLNFNDKHKSDPINLKAVAIGNGLYGNFINNDLVDMVPFLKKHSWMYSNNQTWFSHVEALAKKAKELPNCYNSRSDSTTSDECYKLLDDYYSTLQLPSDFPLPTSCVDLSGTPLYLNPYNIYSKSCEKAKEDLSVVNSPWSVYLDSPEVQKVLHAKVEPYSACARIPGGIYESDPSLLPQYFIGSLVDRGLKVILYSGLYDSVVPHTATEATIRQLKWRGQKGFKHSKMNKATMTPIFTGKPRRQTGLFHSEKGLTYVTIDKAGHMVPRDDPITALWMMEKLVLK